MRFTILATSGACGTSTQLVTVKTQDLCGPSSTSCLSISRAQLRHLGVYRKRDPGGNCGSWSTSFARHNHRSEIRNLHTSRRAQCAGLAHLEVWRVCSEKEEEECPSASPLHPPTKTPRPVPLSRCHPRAPLLFQTDLRWTHQKTIPRP